MTGLAGAAGPAVMPYVPGRLVIEVSGPAGNTGQVTGDLADGEITSGRLALVRGSRTAGTEVTGR